MKTAPGLGIVPARGGSRRLRRKNLETVGGETLVARAVSSGLESEWCERVVCSTDDAEIAASARAAGAEILMRPARLAQDDTSSEAVVRHVLDSYDASWPWFVLLQPTSPLRTAAHVRAAMELLDEDVDAVVSVVAADVHPFKFLVAGEAGGLAPVRTTADLSTPRQLLPEAWHPNGAVYVCRTAVFVRDNTFFPASLRILAMDRVSSIDIDTAEDLKRARYAADELGSRMTGAGESPHR